MGLYTLCLHFVFVQTFETFKLFYFIFLQGILSIGDIVIVQNNVLLCYFRYRSVTLSSLTTSYYAAADHIGLKHHRSLAL